MGLLRVVCKLDSVFNGAERIHSAELDEHADCIPCSQFRLARMFNHSALLLCDLNTQLYWNNNRKPASDVFVFHSLRQPSTRTYYVYLDWSTTAQSNGLVLINSDAKFVQTVWFSHWFSPFSPICVDEPSPGEPGGPGGPIRPIGPSGPLVPLTPGSPGTPRPTSPFDPTLCEHYNISHGTNLIMQNIPYRRIASCSTLSKINKIMSNQKRVGNLFEMEILRANRWRYGNKL